MKSLLLMLTVVFALVFTSFGQKSSPTSDQREISVTRKEMIRELRNEVRQSGDLGVPSAVSAGDVGEIDSFDKAAKFMGIASSGVMYVYSSCDPAILLNDLGLVLGSDDRCLAAPNPGVTSTATFTDIARINLPAKANANILYMVNNHTINWQFENPIAGNTSALMSYSPQVTIESVALNDPTAINPDTGLPMNGSFTTTGNGTKSVSKALFQGDFETLVDSYSRANTLGFSRTYFAALGLPNNVINELFKKPMTIRLGARISVRNVPFGQYVYTARFFGN